MPGKDVRPNNHFVLKLAGKEAIGKFRECSGLTSENEIVEHKEVDAKGNPYIRKVSGNMKWGDVTLKRGVDDNRGLWEWRKVVEEGGPDEARTDAELTLVDYKGEPIVTYSLKQAWPTKYTGAALNANANEIAVEEVTICCEGVMTL